MRIVIKTIPQKEQRYQTIGDYWDEPDGVKVIAVSELGDWRMELLVAVHELIEFSLCDHEKIPEPVISKFDMDHPELDDPGADKRAPYHRQHMFADGIERLLARELNVNWQDYDAAQERAYAVYEEK